MLLPLAIIVYPFKLSEVSKAQKIEAQRGVGPLISAFTELVNAKSVFSLLLLGDTKRELSHVARLKVHNVKIRSAKIRC